MLEMREASKDGIRSNYHGEELLITSIKYTRVVTTIVEDSLPEKPSSEVVSVMASKEETKDSEQPLSASVSSEYEVFTKPPGNPDFQKLPGSPESGCSKISDGVKSVTSSRSYSTQTHRPVQISASVSLVPYVSPPVDLVPRKISLLRGVNGSFYLDEVSMNLLNIDSPDLKDHLSSLITQIRGVYESIESVNAGGYCNITRLSDMPEISSYLNVYVHHPKSDIDSYLQSSKGLDELGLKGILKAYDNILTAREKVVLLP